MNDHDSPEADALANHEVMDQVRRGEVSMENFFGEVIHTYTRAEALEDGVLVDVSKTASEAGFVFPVAVTARVWADLQDIPEVFEGTQDVEGRLWDLLMVLKYTIKAGAKEREIRFSFGMPTSGAPQRLARYEAKSLVGPGDDAEPVLTILAPDED